MSFPDRGQKSISNNTFRVPEDNPRKISPQHAERAFSPSFSGSLSIEASLALPIFIFFSVCIVHFLLLISLQADIQIHIEEAARDLGKAVYTVKDSESASAALINALTIRAKILDDDLSSRIDNSRIRNGTSGFQTLLSSYDCSSGELIIAATYTYDFPYMPDGMTGLSFMQKCCCRAWIGRELDSSGNDGHSESEEGRTVYITPTGHAYHSSPSCPYLDLSISMVSADEIDHARNRSGGRYGKCHCAAAGSAYYYVTGYGILYHSDTNCSDLKRTVMAVDISEAGGRHQCPKCASSGE